MQDVHATRETAMLVQTRNATAGQRVAPHGTDPPAQPHELPRCAAHVSATPGSGPRRPASAQEALHSRSEESGPDARCCLDVRSILLPPDRAAAGGPR